MRTTKSNTEVASYAHETNETMVAEIVQKLEAYAENATENQPSSTEHAEQTSSSSPVENTDDSRGLWGSIQKAYSSFVRIFNPFIDDELSDENRKASLQRFFALGFMALLIMLAYTQLRLIKDLVIFSVGSTSLLAVLKIASIFTAMFGTNLWKYAKDRLATENENGKDLSTTLTFALVIFNLFFLAYAFIPQLSVISLSTILPFLPSSIIACLGTASACVFYLGSELWATIFVNSVYEALLTDIYPKRSSKVKSGSFSLFQSGGNLIASFSMATLFARTTLLSTQLMFVSTSVAVISLLIGAIYYCAKDSFKKAQKSDGTNDNLETTINEIISIFEKKGVNTDSQRSLLLNKAFEEYNSAQANRELKSNHTEAIIASTCTVNPGISDILICRYKSVSSFFYALLAYNTCTVLFELVWKHQVRIFTDSIGILTYGQWMSQYTLYLSIGSIVFALIGPGLSQVLSQEVRSALTPIIFAMFTTLFFCLLLFPGTWAPIGNFIQPLLSAIFGANLSGLAFQVAALGTIECIIVKSSNYSIFKSAITEFVSGLPKQMKDAWRDLANGNAGKIGKGIGGLTITLLGFFVGGGINGSLFLMPAFLGIALAVWVTASVVMNQFKINGAPIIISTTTSAPTAGSDTSAKQLPPLVPEEDRPSTDASACYLGRFIPCFGL